MSEKGSVLAQIERRETLAALPGLLTLARQVIVTAFAPGDVESDALKSLLDECVVGAHRLCLREQIHDRPETAAEGGQVQ